MKAEKRRVTPEYEYILIVNEAEAKYLKALLNRSPNVTSEFLNGGYTPNDIVALTRQGSEQSMWYVLSEVVQE